MPKKHKPAAKPPWYKRTSTFIIAAGALAAAILGVLNLWDRIFPPPDDDVARIESIHLIKRTPLTGFAPEGIGGLLPLTAVPEAASAGRIYDDGGLAGAGFVQAAPPAGRDAAAAPQVTGLEQFTMRPLPTVRPVPRPTFLTFTPEPTPTPTPTRTTATPSPTPTGTSTGTGSPTYSPGPTMTKLKIPKPLTADIRDVIAEQKVLSIYVPEAAQRAIQYLSIEPVDETGESLPPAELAVRLAAALEEVESTTGPQGEDPQGWTVAVRVDLQGLADVPLLLTWSLDGLDVPLTWQAEKLAYRVVGGTPHDAGVAEIWVPDLKRSGAYNVNIKLSYEATGVIADLRPLALPDTGVTQGG
ncbi:hypothetical protein [Pseudarthrobacter scleromae]|uniref:Uncharacterized protein n=1 Tax=Pseudarthrobacter scleromae TaxID=158897 RepID=A0ABQ2C917_9MICC|nr:hypothetical protein [Pseudarthrobacter scleromae]GGI69159.1 hypothetical protein GCM10007175_02320 [Pseudarthrobacter scleromae]